MDEGKREGWVAFVIAMAMIAGSANAIFGLVALFAKGAFPEAGHAFLTLQQWGWALILLGVLQFVVAFMLSLRKNWARILGMVLAAVSIVSWTTWSGTFPLSAITALVLDVLIIYGLAVTKEFFE